MKAVPKTYLELFEVMSFIKVKNMYKKQALQRASMSTGGTG
jgi:hypothetical protein